MKLIETITKQNSQSKVEIFKENWGKGYGAFHSRGEGHNSTFFGANHFKTLAGAEKWAAAKLA